MVTPRICQAPRFGTCLAAAGHSDGHPPGVTRYHRSTPAGQRIRPAPAGRARFAATGLMRRPPASRGLPATAAERFQAAKARADTALSEFGARLSSLEDPANSSTERLAEYMRIESISSVYGLLQAQLDFAPTRHYVVREVTDPVLDSLREAGNLIGTLDRHPKALSTIAKKLQTERQKLREVL